MNSEAEKSIYVVISGTHTSTKTPPDYVRHIVYGEPEIWAVLVGSHFVALCRYDQDEFTTARHTFERMQSFPHVATLIRDAEIAWREFGIQVGHYAPRPSAEH